ncbi:chemotaxis protein CheW [uncultured Lamprocystis sp.]|jgi:purine-binding chemotaxis protein CheW|uniref:chemotaxis protein CheW n=1 Tax=uncultured Lamprocystis sp. TaxID=543132 RepID=UPI0025FE4D7C|nr:chemotaxis protein CheW [uncultured Lamprocystis sp.]
MNSDAKAPSDAPMDALTAALERRRRGDQNVVAVDLPTVQWVVFTLSGRTFAFPGTQVAEILPLPPIYFVPGCPPALEGVIDVRGNICSVLRLGDLLDSPHGPPTRRTAILRGRAADMESGLRVDAVEDVLEVAQEALLTPPDNLPERLQGLVTGVFQHRGQRVLALDMERLFQSWRDARL